MFCCPYFSWLKTILFGIVTVIQAEQCCIFVRFLGKIWSWGDGDYGKLGRGGSDSCKSPKLVEKFQDEHVIKVLCGSQVSLVLTQEGNVWTW